MTQEKHTPPTEEEFAQRLIWAIQNLSDNDDESEAIDWLLEDCELECLDDISICTFQEAGLLTRDTGLILTINGTEPRAQFQITIVDSSSRL